jgi:adenine-specific DNA-methyltransferase
MNFKRGAIETFIGEGLPKAISEEFESGALADESQASAELADTAAQIRQTLVHPVKRSVTY